MSQDNTHFAVALPLTRDQAAKAQEILVLYGEWALAQEEEQLPFEREISEEQAALFASLYKGGAFGCDVGIEVKWDDRRPDQEPMLTDYSGDPNLDLAGEFLRYLIKEYQLEEPIAFDWACTSDRNRPGAFGGGAAIVRAGGIEWMNTRSWIEDRMPAPYSLAEAMALRDDEVMDIDSGARGARLFLSDDERDTLLGAYKHFVDQVDPEIRDGFEPGETMRNWDIFSVLRVNGQPLEVPPAPAP